MYQYVREMYVIESLWLCLVTVLLEGLSIHYIDKYFLLVYVGNGFRRHITVILMMIWICLKTRVELKRIAIDPMIHWRPRQP